MNHTTDPQAEFTAELAERTVLVRWPDNERRGATPPADDWQDRAWSSQSTLHEIDEGIISGCSVLRWRNDLRPDAELIAVSLALVSGAPLPAVLPSVVVSADRATLRAAVVEVLRPHASLGGTPPRYEVPFFDGATPSLPRISGWKALDDVADAVLAVLPDQAEWDALCREAGRLRKASAEMVERAERIEADVQQARADRATLRDRIADIVMPFLLNFSDEGSARINAAEVATALLAVLPAPEAVCICGHLKQQHFEDVCITEITGCNCGDYLEPQDAAEVIDRWRQAALQARTADRATLLREAADAVFALDYDELRASDTLDSHRQAWELGTIDAVNLLRRMASGGAAPHGLAAATCSAEYHGHGEPPRLCIRAAQHTGKAHTDENGIHWSDTVAVYPVADGTWRVGTDVRALLRRVAAEEQPAETQDAGPACTPDRAALRDRVAAAVDEGFRLYAELEDLSLGASITDSVMAALDAVRPAVVEQPDTQTREA